jgi:hypothetical protein
MLEFIGKEPNPVIDLLSEDPTTDSAELATDQLSEDTEPPVTDPSSDVPQSNIEPIPSLPSDGNNRAINYSEDQAELNDLASAPEKHNKTPSNGHGDDVDLF